MDEIENHWLHHTHFGASMDERRISMALYEALSQLRRSDSAERGRLLAKIDGLRCELARTLTRTGREHHATAIWSDHSDEAGVFESALG